MDLSKKFDISSLKKAIATLEEAIVRHEQKQDDKFVRDACIQRFEYTYELTHKTLRRYMGLSEPSEEVVKEMSFPELIRTACERGLMENDWGVWQRYREARNMTSHTYDETKANKVMAVIPNFLKDAQVLLKVLEKRTNRRA